MTEKPACQVFPGGFVSLCVRQFLSFWLLVSVAFSAQAQSGSAELTGEVRDPSGALVPGAPLVLTNLDSGETSPTESSDGGVYLLLHIKPGRYRLAANVRGFQPLVHEDITLVTGQRASVNLALTVGGATQQITVQADASPLKTESPSLTQAVPNHAIGELPLNGRTFINLVELSAGVALPPGSQLPRLNGGRPRVNEYLYDGISVLQPEPGQVAFFPIVEAIQEFSLITNTPGAEFGRFNGGVVNLTTKSGTNAMHGSLFEFLRNEVLNAKNRFAPVGSSRPVFRRNQFGGILGGPIQKDKTFFFMDYQGTRQLIGRIRTSTVPTSAERDGDFSALLGSGLYRTASGTVTTSPSGNTPILVNDTDGNTIQARQNMVFRPADQLAYAGNRIPSNTFDPVSTALLAHFPGPTSSAAANNFTRVANEPDNQDQFDVRLDHHFSERDSFFGRYSYARDNVAPVAFLPDGSGALTTTNSTALGPQDTLGQALASSYVHVFNPALSNELRFGYTRRSISRAALLLDAPPSQSLNLPGVPANGAFNNELPTFLIGGFQQLGPPASTDSDFRTDVTEWADNVAWLKGRQAFKFGWDMRFSRLDILQPPSPTGQFTFSTLFTNGPGITGTGNSLASFLLGQVQLFSIDLQQRLLRPRAWVQEFFAQDDWKATSRLTVSAGLRYTLNLPSTEVDNQGAIFNLQTEQLQYLGQDGFPRTARRLHWHDFGPRLGLAYMLTPKTVVRSGYGLTWFDQAGITTPFTNPQFPFLQTTSQSTLNNLTPAFTLANGPSVAPVSPTPDAGLGQGVFSVDRSQTSGYVQQWNLAIQRQVRSNFSFEVAYAGSKGTHIGVPDTNLNQLPVSDLALGSALQQSVPNPFFGQIPVSSSIGRPTISVAQLMKSYPKYTTVTLFRNNVGNTDYHALQLRMEKRVSNGFWFLASYTRSKLIDDASSVFDASVLTGPIANFPVADSFDRRLEQDVSNGDIPNAFAVSWTYDLPIGRGHAVNPRGVVGKFASGWRVAGIVTLESGIPIAVTQTTNNLAFAGFGTQRPNCAGPTSFAQRTVAEWFDVSAITVNNALALGTCSRNPVRGPGFQDADMALIKRTSLSERFSVDFRAEFFNLTNTPPLGAPNAVAGSAGFGSITSASDPRVVQLALKLNF
jgi:hypothetical protein